LEQLLTIAEAAEICGLSTKTLYGLAADGQLPHARIGKAVRISPAALRKWIEEKTVAQCR
jgi:excisionase family DNA binding protein